MSALLHIGEADHKLLCIDAELAPLIGVSEFLVDADTHFHALTRARELLAKARADLGAIRLALRAHALNEMLEYHQAMAEAAREAAKLARMPPGRGLHLQAERHRTHAAALRVLIGSAEPVLARGGGS